MKRQGSAEVEVALQEVAPPARCNLRAMARQAMSGFLAPRTGIPTEGDKEEEHLAQAGTLLVYSAM